MVGNFVSDGTYVRIFSISGGSSFLFGCSSNRGYEIISNIPNDISVTCLYAENGAQYIVSSSYENYAETGLLFTISGAVSIFIHLTEGASFSMRTSRTWRLRFNSSLTSGQRYYLSSGGMCNTGGQGSEFFPGTTAGYVESSTYSWYK